MDENVLMSSSSHRGKFQCIDLYDWDYLVVDCGYVDRLVQYTDDIIEKTKRDLDDDDEGSEEVEHPLIFFMDSVGSKTYELTEVQPDTVEVYDALMKLILKDKIYVRGAVCFKQGDWDVDLVEMLTEYQHCGCFGTTPYQVASFTTESGKKVLYKKFDTESG